MKLAETTNISGEDLTGLPNIGKILAGKLQRAGINNLAELKRTGSENALAKIVLLKDGQPCIDMLYALEGAIQGIRWHKLDKGRKEELKAYYNSIHRQEQNK